MKNKSVYLLLSIFLLSIIIHLKGINSPLLDFHSWRQTQTAMIARNYYRNGFIVSLSSVTILALVLIFLVSMFTLAMGK